MSASKSNAPKSPRKLAVGTAHVDALTLEDQRALDALAKALGDRRLATRYALQVGAHFLASAAQAPRGLSAVGTEPPEHVKRILGRIKGLGDELLAAEQADEPKLESADEPEDEPEADEPQADEPEADEPEADEPEADPE